MLFFCLILLRLMALETADVLLAVNAHLVLVHDGILRSVVALRALALCFYKCRVRLSSFRLRTGSVNQECCHDFSENPITTATKTVRNMWSLSWLKTHSSLHSV